MQIHRPAKSCDGDLIFYRNFLDSPMVTFVVGENEKRMAVHSALIAAHSPVLKTILQSGMEESISMVIRWDDVGEETFAAFAQFLYSNDYMLAPVVAYLHKKNNDKRSTIRNLIAEEPRAEVESLLDVGDESSKATGGYKKRRRVYGLKVFKRGLYPDPRLSWSLKMGWQRFGGEPNLASVPLEHARLYVLAEKYGMEALEKFALHNLFELLSNSQWGQTNFQDITKLVKFAYENTPSYNKKVDGLRELVVRFVVGRESNWVNSQACGDFAFEDKDFPNDLFTFLQISGSAV